MTKSFTNIYPSISKIIFFLIFVSLPSKSIAQSTVSDLTVDYTTNPLGIDNISPVLSWKIQDIRRNINQTGYQIIVSSSERNLKKSVGDIWDTGKIISDQSINILYHGQTLTSQQQYYWKVKVWNNVGEETNFSEPAKWEMGLLNDGDWKGRWISQVQETKGNPPLLPAPLFRKSIIINAKKIKRARAYITGLGYHELFINGAKVGDHVLDPVLTRYDKRVKFVTHDITSLLTKGENVIGVTLGNGWYNQHTKSAWDFDKAPWRNAPVLRCQFEVEFIDGTKSSWATDRTWKVTHGPVLFDGIRNGEIYDSRNEIPGWNNKGFDDHAWKNSFEVSGPSGLMSSQVMPPIRIIKKIKPKKITLLYDQTYLVDFGVNISGRIRLSVKGEQGNQITIRYGEKLLPDGFLDQKELARFIRTGETQTDHFITNGHEQSWTPTFTYYGFQYAEVSGFPGELSSENIEAEILYTDLKDAGSFSCSNDLFNQLNEATRLSFLTNYHGYPTDCPHREKIGWSGDAQLTSELGLYNFEMEPSYRKWLDDFCDEQQSNGHVSGIIPTSGWGYTLGRDTTESQYKRGYGPQWEGAFVTIPWNMFQYYGDTTIIKRYYNPLKQYLKYLTDHANNHLLDFGIDDHKPVKIITDPPILSSGFYYHIATILSKMAGVISSTDDKIYFDALSDSIKNSFNEEYYNTTTSMYGNGGQTSLSEALYFDLTTDDNKALVLKNLIADIEGQNDHFDAGVLGVKFITNVLTHESKDEILYKMLNKRDYPSFGNWIENGATTLWQEWDGSRSLNHIMFGSFSEFFYEGLAGINSDPNHPGFKHFYITPSFVKNIDWVKSTHQSPYGKIQSNWTRQSDEIIFEFTIPTNSKATVSIPSSEFSITSGEKVLTKELEVTRSNNEANFHLGSGSYKIIFKQ